MASGSSASSMLQRAVLLHPSGRDGGLRSAVAVTARRVVGAASATVLAAGTVAGRPQARQSRVRPTDWDVEVNRRPQWAHENRIRSSAGFPHFGQPAGLSCGSWFSPHEHVTNGTSEVYPGGAPWRPRRRQLEWRHP